MICKANTELARALQGVKLSQEEVSQKLCCGSRTLSKYLYGELYPPCEVIAKAITEFNAHDLGMYHLNERCPVAKLYMKQMELKELAQSVLLMQKSLADVNKLQSNIVEIACDGCVDNSERIAWQAEVDGLKTIIGRLISMIASGEKGARHAYK